MELASLLGPGSVPVIIALVEVVKRSAPRLDKRWLPIVAVALGVGWALATLPQSGQDARTAVALGLVYGLTAIGLFSGGRATAGQ